MEELNYQPPLRGAALSLLRNANSTISAEQMAERASVPVDRAKAYLSILVAGNIIIHSNLLFRCGPGWAEWQQNATRSRPRKSAHRCADEMDRLRIKLSRNIMKFRSKANMTPAQLAEKSGVSKAAISKMESRCEPPTAAAVYLIAQALGIRTDDLFAS